MAEKTKNAVVMYSIDELANAAESLFQTKKIVVKAALKTAGKQTYTEKEAVKIVSAFKSREVK